jgi:hypothetical protein
MVRMQHAPLIDADGEARQPTRAEALWAVRTQDFGDVKAVHKFLRARAELLKAAEAAGLSRDLFLPLKPNLPGFEDRVAAAFGTVIGAINNAAE